MMLLSILSAAAANTSTLAQPGPIQGFNYGNLKITGELKVRADYEAEFTAAKNLNGTNSRFTSARLYTSIQGGGQGVPNEAIQAAINTGTTLMLGLWCSAGDAVFANELASVKNALAQYGAQLRPLLVGISVGSEDLYRFSPLNQGTDPGADPAKIAEYVRQVKAIVNANPTFVGVPVGHVDTWNAFMIGSSVQVINEIDFLGMNSFPYFQTADVNTPENNPSLFAKSLAATQSVSQGKPVWVTETGFPVYGPTYNLAVPSIANAKAYYDAVGCAQLFGKVNTWWYIILDGVSPAPADAATSTPSFGVVSSPLKDTSIYDLSCAAPNVSSAAVNTDIVINSEAPSPVATPSVSIASTVLLAPTSATTLTTLPSPASVSPFGTPALSSPSNAASSSNASPASTSSTSSTGSCPADLNGSFEFPHLLVPVSSTQPNTPLGTQYSGTINPTTSSIYNFDVNSNLAGKTCSLIFLFPRKDQLTWSSFTFNNQGGVAFTMLDQPATQQTSFSNVPAANMSAGTVNNVEPGNSYVVSSAPCPAGQTIGFKADATGGLDLGYFQEMDPAAPIGLYLRAC